MCILYNICIICILYMVKYKIQFEINIYNCNESNSSDSNNVPYKNKIRRVFLISQVKY